MEPFPRSASQISLRDDREFPDAPLLLESRSAITFPGYIRDLDSVGDMEGHTFQTRKEDREGMGDEDDDEPEINHLWPKISLYRQSCIIGSIEMMDEFRRNCFIDATTREDYNGDQIFAGYTRSFPRGVETHPDFRSPTEEALLSVFFMDRQIEIANDVEGVLRHRRRKFLKRVAERANYHAKKHNLDPFAAVEKYKAIRNISGQTSPREQPLATEKASASEEGVIRGIKGSNGFIRNPPSQADINAVRSVASLEEMDNLIFTAAAQRPRLGQPGEGVEAYWLRVIGWLELPDHIEPRKELRTEMEEQLLDQFFLDRYNMKVAQKWSKGKDQFLRALYNRLVDLFSHSNQDPTAIKLTLRKIRKEAKMLNIESSIEQFITDEEDILQGEQFVIPTRAPVNQTTESFREDSGQKKRKLQFEEAQDFLSLESTSSEERNFKKPKYRSTGLSRAPHSD